MRGLGLLSRSAGAGRLMSGFVQLKKGSGLPLWGLATYPVFIRV